MLTRRFFARLQSGFSLIELLIGIALIAILLGLGGPNFVQWIQSSQIRTQAESLQNGLQLARAEAVRRNVPVRFQLTSTDTDACALSTTGANWVVSQDDPAGACASVASDTVAPRIIQARTAKEGSSKAVVAADQSWIGFNALGRVTPAPAANININVSNPTGGACAAAGPMRCLRLVVSVGGQIRMCDPAVAANTNDSRAC
jgi:type IV fimbrial biogenesis protein FimT